MITPIEMLQLIKMKLINSKKKCPRFIIDLRNNGGGSLKTVVDITGYFIKDGPVVQVKILEEEKRCKGYWYL